jgi:hypothetical protein
MATGKVRCRSERHCQKITCWISRVMMWLVAMLACQLVDPSDALAPASPPTAPQLVAPQPAQPAPPLPNPDPPFEAWSTAATTGVQIAAGAAACCVVVGGFGLLAFIPGGFCLSCLVAPMAIVGTEVFIADRYGAKRGAFVAPFVVSTAGTAMTLGSMAVLYFANLFGPQSIGTISRNDFVMLSAVAVGVMIIGALGMVIGPAVTYQVLAVDKLPGDRGQGSPGLLSPAQPIPPEAPPPTVGRVEAYSNY